MYRQQLRNAKNAEKREPAGLHSECVYPAVMSVAVIRHLEDTLHDILPKQIIL